MIATTKSSKRQTKQTKLDRLLAQGTLIETDVDGRRAVFLKMPTPELQSTLNEELEKKIKQRLKAGGFERVCATRRDHPFHSELLQKRIDDLARDITVVDHKRGTWSRLYMAPDKVWKLLTERHADWHEGMQAFRAIWAKAYEEHRDVLFWSNDPALRPRPKPVFVSKQSDIVVSLQNGSVDLWVKV